MYIHGNVLLKLADDSVSLYGSDYLAGKAAGTAMLTLQHIISHTRDGRAEMCFRIHTWTYRASHSYVTGVWCAALPHI